MQILIYILTYVSFSLIGIAGLSTIAEKYRVRIAKKYLHIMYLELNALRIRERESRAAASGKNQDEELSWEQEREEEIKWFRENGFRNTILFVDTSNLLDQTMISDIEYSRELETIVKTFKLIQGR